MFIAKYAAVKRKSKHKDDKFRFHDTEMKSANFTFIVQILKLEKSIC